VIRAELRRKRMTELFPTVCDGVLFEIFRQSGAVTTLDTAPSGGEEALGQRGWSRHVETDLPQCPRPTPCMPCRVFAFLVFEVI